MVILVLQVIFIVFKFNTKYLIVIQLVSRVFFCNSFAAEEIAGFFYSLDTES